MLQIARFFSLLGCYSILTIGLTGAAVADIGTGAAVSPEPGLDQVWVGVATFSTDPYEDYNGGQGVYSIMARISSYNGPGGFWGSSSWYSAGLPSQYLVTVSAYNSCVEGYYSIGGSHSAWSGELGFIPMPSTYDARWVDETDCSY
jgi:hypothetical protein